VLLQVDSNLKVSQLPSVTGGGLVGQYIFDQLHFHWSNDVTKEGSVHSFDHVFRFPCEVHLVHFNAKYKTLAEAANHADGVVILVVLMEV